MAFTKINAAGIGTTETVTVDGLTVINDGSFGGNLTVGGVLTYEDVTNVDSVGLITARNGIVVGSGITLSKDGDIFATGITTVSGNVKVGTGITLSPDGDVFFTGIATGNGSGLTALNASNISSGTVPTARLGSGTASSSTFLAGDSTFKTVTGTTINSNADNRLITGSGTANTLNGESNLTFDGNLLKLQCDSGEFRVEAANGVDAFSVDSDNGNTIIGSSGTLTIPDTIVHAGDTDTKIRFPAADTVSVETGGSERARIDSSGRLLIGTTSNTFTSVGSSRLQVSGTGADTAGINLIRTSSDGGGAYLQFTKNRGSATQADDTCGAIAWMGHDGTDVESYLAQIVVKAGATATSNSMTGDITFETSNGSSVPSERMRLDSSGNFGIGNRTSAPDNLLHVHTSSGDAVIHVEAAADPKLRLRAHNGQSIIQFADAASSNTGEIVYDHSGDDLRFRVNASERMRITSGGGLFLGTTTYDGGGTSPDIYVSSTSGRQVKIHNTNSSTSSLQLTNAATGEGDDNGLQIAVLSDQTTYINQVESAPIRIDVNGSERLRITSDGKIGINETNPSRRLHIRENSDTGYAINTATVNTPLMLENEQTGSTKNIGIYFGGAYSNGEGYITMVGDGGGGGDFRFALRSGGSRTDRMTITNDSTINGDFNDTSDINLKENITSMSSTIDKVKQLRPVTFDWKESYRPNNVSGFIAQEVKTIYPDLVRGAEWTAEDPGKHYTINTMGVVAHLTKALQEEIAKREALEARIAALEG